MHGQLTSPCSTSGMCAFQSNLLLPFLAQLSMIITTQKQTNTHTHTHTHTHKSTYYKSQVEDAQNHIIFHKFFTKLKFVLALHTKARILLLCFDSFYRVYSSSLRDFGPLSNNNKVYFYMRIFQR